MEIYVEELLNKKGKIYAVSSKSPFYIDYKGGQLGDRGKIGDASVLSVSSNNGKIYHEIDKEIEPGWYEVEIDLKHQMFVRQHHTAQHILSAVLDDIAEIKTVGFRMGKDYTTIDVNVPYIVEEVLKEVEEKANDIITECVDVEEFVVSKEEASKLPLRKSISDKIEGDVRIIKIGEYDYSACGGYHVKNTGQIGILKILKIEKIKGELTRIYFVAGSKALEYFQEYNKILKNVSNALTSSIFEIENKVLTLVEELKGYKSKIKKLFEDIASYKVENIQNIKGKVYFLEEDPDILKYIPKYFNKEGLLIMYDGKTYSFTSNIEEYDIKDIIKRLRERFGGKGGGSKEKGNYIPEGNIDTGKILEVVE